MCTLTIIPLPRPDSTGGGAGFRVVMNRDEQADRPEALHPCWRTFGRGAGLRRAIAPIDPRSGGTWIAASELGLVLCLLNLNPEPPPAPARDPESRGGIVPGLIGCGSADEALDRLGALDLSRMPAFRLVCVAPGEPGSGLPRIDLARWDRRELGVRRGLASPVCFVSSGLGDSLVTPRLALFEEMVAARPDREAQDRFHRHRWEDRPQVSVLMHRGEARTVSVTTVEIDPGAEGAAGVRMTYFPVGSRSPVLAV